MKEVRLFRASRGAVIEADFAIVEFPEPEPTPGTIITRTLWISADPYIALRMGDDAPAQTDKVAASI